jgi:hypothetical protein
MPRKPTGDATLDAQIDRAMRPYRSLLPPEMQDVFEDLVVMGFREHPVGQALLERLRPSPATHESGPRDTLKDMGIPDDRASVREKTATGDSLPGHARGKRGAESSRSKPRGRGRSQ